MGKIVVQPGKMCGARKKRQKRRKKWTSGLTCNMVGMVGVDIHSCNEMRVGKDKWQAEFENGRGWMVDAW